MFVFNVTVITVFSHMLVDLKGKLVELVLYFGLSGLKTNNIQLTQWGILTDACSPSK